MIAPSSSSSELKGRTFARILLIKPSSLGDVIHALPVLHGLRMRYPDARIDWLISSSLVPFLESHPDVDELVAFDRNRFARIGRSAAATGAFVRFVRALRAGRYDLVLDLQGLFRTGFFARMAGGPVRIGFSNAREGATLFYTHRLGADDPNIHAVDRNYQVAELLGFENVPVAFILPSIDRARDVVSDRLREQGLGEGEPVIVIAPGARWDTKRWRAERFAATIDRLHEQACGRCVLVGGAGEIELCGAIARGCRVAPIDLAGRTNLRELPAIIGKAELVLCQDSAVMHLAVAMERPLVCLIGPTNPYRTGPYRRPEDVVRIDCACAPCYLRKLSRCRHDHRCMAELDVDQVVAAAQRALHRSAVPSN